MEAGYYVIYNDHCQSIDDGEEGTGWPTYGDALNACTDADVPAFLGGRGLVFGRAACMKAELALAAKDKEEAESLSRRAEVLKSYTGITTAPDIGPSPEQKKANLLASNKAALDVELAKKKKDATEIARLRDNIIRLSM